MRKLFEETVLGGIKVKNRLVRSATFEYSADQGRYDNRMREIYTALAEGGVGTIITGMTGVDENSCVIDSMVRAYDPSFQDGLRELAELAHKHNCALVVQLANCGAKVARTDAGLPPVAPSKLPDKNWRELSKEGIADLAESFASAAAKCKEAGADGVQIHAAHGYLLSQFLSPIYNKRQDEYGGEIDGRARAVFEVYEAVRKAVGRDYPVWIKINSQDGEEGGITLEECMFVCKKLSDMGLDAAEISGGIAMSKRSAPARRVSKQEDEAHFLPEALKIAENVSADVISVGGHRSPERMEEAINEGEVKAISLCRPLICEPDIVSRWASGDYAKPKCISCNKCFSPGGLSCKVFK